MKFYQRAKNDISCPFYLCPVLIPLQTIQIVFVTTPTGNVRERPSRLLELSSYTRPMTYIASDGSEIANKLQSSFHSLITDGSSEMFSDMTIDDKIIDEVRWKPDFLEFYTSNWSLQIQFKYFVSISGLKGEWNLETC